MIRGFFVDPVVQGALHAGAALLFGAAAFHKLRDPAGFRASLAGYRLLPARALPMVAAGLALAELALAAGCLAPATAPAACLAGAVLVVAYAGAVAANLARGRRAIDCGCGGPGGRRPLSGGLVVRNVVLAALLVLAALPAGARSLVWLDALSLAGLFAVLALVYAAADVALANAARLRDAGGPAWSTH
jgi:hypothetical protein